MKISFLGKKFFSLLLGWELKVTVSLFFEGVYIHGSKICLCELCNILIEYIQLGEGGLNIYIYIYPSIYLSIPLSFYQSIQAPQLESFHSLLSTEHDLRSKLSLTHCLSHPDLALTQVQTINQSFDKSINKSNQENILKYSKVFSNFILPSLITFIYFQNNLYKTNLLVLQGSYN